ncbi:hypothetical protein Syncc8109_1141 [Synechococcus sp. WH 8109]|nr:hypothetical protein Syncc8109_1141 [Synechococcus sp. WH 8109]
MGSRQRLSIEFSLERNCLVVLDPIVEPSVLKAGIWRLCANVSSLDQFFF